MFIELKKEHIDVKIKITNYDSLILNELMKKQFSNFETEKNDASLFHIKIFIND